MIKRLLLLFLSAFSAIAMFAGVTLGIRGEEAASIGIYVKDITTGQVIAENNAAMSMVPASITKSLTAASALSILGDDFTFTTPVYLYGHKGDGGTWQGNLVIESCGDPTIDSKNFNKRASLAAEIIAGLRANGITTITGRIIVAESLPDAGAIPTWEVEDIAWSYGAGLFGFNFADNEFRVTPATGKSVPEQPGLVVRTFESTDGTAMIRGVGSELLDIYGRRPTDPKWVLQASMPNPASAYSRLLADALDKAGIRVEGRQHSDVSTRMLVCTHTSPKLTDILQVMLFESHNLYAEGLLRALAADGTRDEALKTQRKLWDDRGVAGNLSRIIDGSGLSRGNSMQPLFLANVLEWMAKSAMADAYIAAFPRAGKDGTVKPFLRNTALEGRLALKSGSMNAVHCYAGYMLDSAGKPSHVVVLMINNFYCRRQDLREALEKFLLDTFAQ